MINSLFLNLLIILSAFTIQQLWMEGKPNSTFTRKYSLLITSGLALLLCMMFSYSYQDDIHFDLRRIPLWFGALYGGPVVGFCYI
jgi:two-component system, sporulation sensor kinase B